MMRRELCPTLQAVAPIAPREIYSPAERFADGVIHVLGVFLSLAAVSVLITIAAFMQDGWTVASVAIYGAGVVVVFVASAAYHLIDLPDWRWLLRRFDHAAIFVKIAGTYTPFAMISLAGGWGAALLASVWSIAAVGVPLKLFAPGRFERIAVWLYLIQGWLVVFALGPLAAAISTDALICLITGGVIYTVGVVFFLWEKLPFHNAIWHGCVLTASGCMYAAVLSGVALAPSATMPTEARETAPTAIVADAATQIQTARAAAQAMADTAMRGIEAAQIRLAGNGVAAFERMSTDLGPIELRAVDVSPAALGR